MNAIGGGQPFSADGFAAMAQGNRQSSLAEERQYNGALRNMAASPQPAAITQVGGMVDRLATEVLALASAIDALQMALRPLQGIQAPTKAHEGGRPEEIFPEFPDGTTCRQLTQLVVMLRSLRGSVDNVRTSL